MKVKILIPINGVDVALTEDDARELRDVLNRMFGAAQMPLLPTAPIWPVPTVEPVVIPAPAWPYPGYRPGDVWCNTGTESIN